MKNSFFKYGLITLLCCSTVTIAKEIVISGLMIDSTISRQGHDFANQLSRFWQEIPNTFGKNVVVKEIILPQAGTQVDVIYDKKIIYRTYFGRRLLPLDQKVNQAVVRLVNAVTQTDVKEQNPDLAGDEW
ncbi:MAG: curli production assembly/transport component CsgE [Paraglaciecola sp.]|jgi:curli production assembly/transport component CsgE